MKTASLIYKTAVLAMLWLAIPAWGVSVPVEKAANAPKLYMHYMPWFQTPTSLGGTSSGWGWHWTMNNKNPNVVDASGKRQIAAHYYPKIGPYDSTDSDVIEYHLLLMKYAGVDGALVDWYGVQGSNGDVGSLLTASNAFINKTNSFGIDFAVTLEDRFSRNITDGQANMAYVGSNYFTKPNHIKAGQNNNPLLTIFGPITFTQSSQWNQIMPSLGSDPEFLTLPGKKSMLGTHGNGEYAWPYQDPGTTNHLTKLRSFYTGTAPFQPTAGGVAYPGFNDFYQQGGAGSTLFYIPENDGQTLTDTLNLYTEWSTGPRNGWLDFLQLATFNDFGEGTMFEPTVETGFKYLHKLQEYYQVRDPITHQLLDESDLQLIYQLYLARKKYAGNAAKQTQLAQVSDMLSAMQIDAAQALLAETSPAGDYNADGSVTMSDYNLWRSAFGKSTIIYGSGADGDYNGSIDMGDFLIWRKNLGAGGNGAGFAASIPEPSTSGALVVVAVSLFGAAIGCRQRAKKPRWAWLQG